MTPKPRYLSKSRFKKGLECPTKLFYTGKPEYEDQSESDSFLEALAEGGYQVGELAKCYHRPGIEITATSNQKALEETQSHLKKDNVILYEPAFLFDHLFVRVDILVKKKNKVQLIEVKSKSFTDSADFWNTNGIAGGWQSYLLDVAFQQHVLSHAHREWHITPYLMLADKTAIATVDGLNQAFPVTMNSNGRLAVHHKPLDDYGSQILVQQNVAEEVSYLLEQTYAIDKKDYDFSGYVNTLSQAYAYDQMLKDGVGAKCKGCEFKSETAKSGFVACWKNMAGIDLSKNKAPLLFDLTQGRINKYLENKLTFIHELPIEDFEPPTSGSLNHKNRRYLQVVKTKTKDHSLHFEKEHFAALKSGIQYPLHMIDFETTSVAIPFHAGMRPYEQIAFQFSHHVIEENGHVRHQTEWINTEKGQFPNFEFVRKLKEALEVDEGTIFRYSHHENTVLKEIKSQLYTSHEADRVLLMEFIDHITGDNKGYVGERNMLDLCQWVKESYFDIHTKGSSSLKLILPSILNRSTFLQEKYSQPIYGKEIPSLSIGNATLIQKAKEGNIQNPYQLLPPVFEHADDDDLDHLWSRVADISEGGTAMTAYAKMQFADIPDWERERITSALLRYCELDTMAMVLLWEGLNDLAQ